MTFKDYENMLAGKSMHFEGTRFAISHKKPELPAIQTIPISNYINTE
jgi:hypothetical protein